MLRNVYRDIQGQAYVPQAQRPVFQPTQLEQGLWLELIPNKLKMIIVEPGAGPTPKTGEFIRLKQFIYLADMTVLKQERITYTFNRNKIILGLQYCLALCREGFKGRIFIPSELAYGKEVYPGIPANSDIVVDMEVSSITSEPVSMGKYDDEQLIEEIIGKAKDGDEHLKRGELASAQRCFQTAFACIQSTRSRQIKNHLYYNSRVASMISSSEKTPAQIKREKEELVKIFQIFDRIKVKTVEVLLINKDYYKVLMLTRQCLMESRLEQNCRILTARSRAFTEVGEYQKGMELMQRLSDQYPNQKIYQEELKRAQSKANNQQLEQQNNQLLAEPILTLSNPNTRKTKTKQRKKDKGKELKYESNVEELYEADGEVQRPQEPFFSDIGMKFFYQGPNDD